MSVKLSVVVPIYNPNKEHLLKAVESLNHQTFKDFIVIWVFTSFIEEVVVEQINAFAIFPCKFLVAKEKGIAAALNCGLDVVETDYVARFDADDLCHPNRFELQLDFLECNRHVDICGSDIIIVGDDGRVVAKRFYPSSDNSIKDSFLFKSPLAHPAIVFRKSLFGTFRYCERFRSAEDLELFLRLRNNDRKFHNLPYPLLYYRENQIVRSRTHLYYNFLARLKNLKYTSDLISIALSLFILFLPSGIISFLKLRLYSK